MGLWVSQVQVLALRTRVHGGLKFQVAGLEDFGVRAFSGDHSGHSGNGFF